MKNKFKLFGLAVLLTAIVFSFAACKNDSDPTPTPLTDPALNGTWKSGVIILQFNNGTYEEKGSDGSNKIKGTFTTSGSSITMTLTHLWGAALPSSLTAKWYSKADLKAPDVLTSLSMTAEQVDVYFANNSGTYTYVISGNTLTLNDFTYTKQ